MAADKELLLLCAVAIAAGGEKNVKNIVSKAQALAEELGVTGDDSDSDDTEADDNSDSEDDDSSPEVEDENTDSEDDEEGNEGEDDSEEEDDEEEKPKPVKQTAKGTGKKNFKKKPQAYDRESDTHKELFSGVLKAVKPDWKKDAASKKRAKDVSAKLEGEDFLDADGNVLVSFKQSVKKLMLAKK